MTLANFAAFKDAVARPSFAQPWAKDTTSPNVDSRCVWWSTWGMPQGAGATPSTAVAPDNTLAGCIPHPSAASRLCLASASNGAYNSLDLRSHAVRTFMLCDRLSHQGGLVGNVGTVQTTNLPTAALTRYVDGVGVLVAIEIYSTVGVGTGSLITVLYTNTADQANRVGTLPAETNNSFYSGLFFPVCLQAGDVGVKSVQSVQISSPLASTGNFGVTLYKPLAIWSDDVVANEIVGWNTGIHADACLQLLPHNATTPFSYNMSILSFMDV